MPADSLKGNDRRVIEANGYEAQAPLVMVVEDFEDNRFMMRRLLEMSGYRVVEAMNGEEAIEIARRERPGGDPGLALGDVTGAVLHVVAPDHQAVVEHGAARLVDGLQLLDEGGELGHAPLVGDDLVVGPHEAGVVAEVVPVAVLGLVAGPQLGTGGRGLLVKILAHALAAQCS